MSPKRQRLWFILVSLVLICVAALLVMQAFRDTVVFFYTPAELVADSELERRFVRIGGLVVTGSVTEQEGIHRFRITDGATEIDVAYSGLLPTLFREGQGVVAEGKLENGIFQAQRILARHDENYMPREVVDALKKSGRWRELPPAARGTP